jgi:predicted nucleic acid-binding protein
VNRSPRVAYLDSSALVKLVIPEPESLALRRDLARWDRYASSALARAEVVRACVRVDPAARDAARRVVDAVDLIAVGNEILDEAARLEPAALRTLDAIHLASALALGEALDVVVAYDERLAGAARSAGLSTRAPR